MALALLLFGAAVSFYIVAGYPLLLSRLSWRKAPAVQKDAGFTPLVSVIIAVYNGGRFLRAKLESVLAFRYPAERLEIIVVSDGSTDGSDSIAESYAARGVRLLRVPHAGKAAALNAAMAQCSGEVLFFTDVRQPIAPDALARMTANFADPSVGAVSGELRYLSRAAPGQQADIELYWRYELWARQRHAEIHSMFGATGAIYAARRGLVEPIPPDTLSDDVLIPVRIFLRGYRVVFEPGALAFDYPAAPGGEFRRKLRTLAGLWQVFVRTPRLFYAAPMRLHFVSHKFGRVALPWALLAVTLAGFALPDSPARMLLLPGGAALATLAVTDYFIPSKFPLKRLTSPARTFFAMNVAALVSTAILFAPPRWFWGRTTPVAAVAGDLPAKGGGKEAI